MITGTENSSKLSLILPFILLERVTLKTGVGIKGCLIRIPVYQVDLVELFQIAEGGLMMASLKMAIGMGMSELLKIGDSLVIKKCMTI